MRGGGEGDGSGGDMYLKLDVIVRLVTTPCVKQLDTFCVLYNCVCGLVCCVCVCVCTRGIIIKVYI